MMSQDDDRVWTWARGSRTNSEEGKLEATTGIEPVYAVLQTAPWPLGHVATEHRGRPSERRLDVVEARAEGKHDGRCTVPQVSPCGQRPRRVLPSADPGLSAQPPAPIRFPRSRRLRRCSGVSPAKPAGPAWGREPILPGQSVIQLEVGQRCGLGRMARSR